MPESVSDRLARKHETVFMFSKSSQYFFDLDAVRQAPKEATRRRARPHRADPGKAARSGAPYKGVAAPQTLRVEQMVHPAGRNPGDVWVIPTAPFAEAHFAVMPLLLAEQCALAGCPVGGTLLDPFHGSGTSGLAAQRLGLRYIGVDLNAEYLDLSLRTRLQAAALPSRQAW
jgi:site-specific DNA-methyltransferase (cytosine-N4-specific)